jgi:hypothetical protein
LDKTGLSKSTLHRYLTMFGRQPHRSKSFKLLKDPFIIEKVRDLFGLHLDPPDHALVLCVDETSQHQALERVQPVLPMRLGYVEGITHDHVPRSTTTLLAALDVVNVTIVTQYKPKHRHQEFLAFAGHIEAESEVNLKFSDSRRRRVRHPIARRARRSHLGLPDRSVIAKPPTIR